ncbi:guanine nucleotide-binding protein subunit alpha-11 [Reticulomyxa filosa]|uniref:Guanine nucleotide-binding protein subunit alpha-11 n=1 Tax=Reticulomyxa filosa TaxID=46433 RepID=X6MW27_RETFI|nr:guanine nucleotide-binding protein subunit alpha-11 [Reticulomyxa filosa]|eukprot:ETO18203.1 guanine nucleotide-binding protein subunit alpha-11 [Reticulomyxa filosa]
MGNNTSTPKQVNKEIKKKLNTEAKQAQRRINGLLLGPGGSGKSTVLKQMSKIYNGFIEDKKMANAVISIRKNIIYDMSDICVTYLEERSKNQNEIILSCEQNKFDLFYQYVLNQYPKDTDTNTSTKSEKKEEVKDKSDKKTSDSDVLFNKEEMEPLIVKFARMQDTHPDHAIMQLNPVLAKKIGTLWKYPGIQYAYEVRKLSHVMDNTPWLLDRVETIADPNYEGSFEAYVRLRDRTTEREHIFVYVMSNPCKKKKKKEKGERQ